MANRICLYCKNYHPETTVYDGIKYIMAGVGTPKYKKVPRHCDLYPEKCEQWWKENGDLRPDEAAQMDCFEITEVQKNLDEIADTLEDLLTQLKEFTDEHN